MGLDYISESIEEYIENNQGIHSLGGYIPQEKIKIEFYKICNYLWSLDNSALVVGIYFTKDYRYLLVILSAMYTGHTYVPLNKKFPKSRNQQIIDISEVDMVISDIEDKELLSNYVNYDLILDNEEVQRKQVELLDKEKALYYIFTSGSTGAPKGVMIPRRGFIMYLKWMQNCYEVDSTDRFLSFADFTFDISFVDIGLLLTKNIEFYFSSFNGNIVTMMQEIEKYSINVLSSVPTNLTLMLSSPVYKRFNINDFKLLILGGARTSKKLYKLLQVIYPTSEIHNSYGPTEATVYITDKKFQKDKTDFDKNNASVGLIREDANVLIVDDSMNELKDEEVGEILVSGEQLLLGYKNNEQKTKEVFVYINQVLYYKVGDLGYKNNNNLYIVGRVDDTIKTRGYRVNLSDIESYVDKLEYINESVIVAIEDENIENKLYLFVTIHDTVTKEKIYNDLKMILPDYQIPLDVIIKDRMPLNNSGKISKIELKKDIKVS